MVGAVADKILVIGLDGATFDLITPWADDGKLPNFARLLRHGSYGSLSSTMHPVSPSAWASFQTGMNPGKHGIYDFLKLNPGEAYTPHSGDSLAGKRFWEVASASGKKVVAINLLWTYPPRPINGMLVSGRMTPPGAICTYPPKLLEEIDRHVGKYVVEADSIVESGREVSEAEFVQSVQEAAKRRAQAAFYLLDSYEWDLGIVVFTALDTIQHFFWRYLDPNQPDYSPDAQHSVRDAILHTYRQMDDILGEFEDKFSHRVIKIVVSDHGFGPIYKQVNLNRWLLEQGFLYPKYTSLNPLLSSLRTLARRALPSSLRRRVRTSVIGHSISRMGTLEVPSINWSQTKAYALGIAGNIYVNLRGREASGIVEPGEEYERLRQEIIDKLMAWKNPLTGQELVEKAHRREELYDGPAVAQAPDVIIEWKDYAYLAVRPGRLGQPLFSEPASVRPHPNLRYSGTHRKHGIFMAAGEGVKFNHRFEGAHIMDVAPTILNLMGLPIPREMDGRVLVEILQEDRRLQHPVTYQEESLLAGRTGEGDAVHGDEEVEAIKERLRGLGYL